MLNIMELLAPLFGNDFSKIALFLLFFACIALVFEIFYFRRHKAKQAAAQQPQATPTVQAVTPQSKDFIHTSSFTKSRFKGRNLVIIGLLAILLLLPVSVFVVFQQVNLSQNAQTQQQPVTSQTAAVVACDQIDILKSGSVSFSTSFNLNDTVSFDGFCFSQGGQNQITQIRFVLNTPSGPKSPAAFLAKADVSKTTADKQYMQAHNPNVRLVEAGNYTMQIFAYNETTPLTTQPFSKTFSVAASQTSTATSPTPTTSQAIGGGSVGQGGLPVCDNLSAIPLIGPAPLTVSFTATGHAVNGTIASFVYTFGDGKTQTARNTGSQTTNTLTHVYTQAGTYTASLRVTDSAGATSAQSPLCQTQITVSASTTTSTSTISGLVAQPTRTSTPTPTIVSLPVSGISLPMMGFTGIGLLLLTFGLLLVF